MNAIQFLNNLGEDLEQGDVVVIGKNQTLHSYGSSGEMFVPEVDLTQLANDTCVCGIVASVHVEIQLEAAEEAKPKATAKPAQSKASKGRARKETLTVQAYTLEELAELDRSKVGAGQMGWLITQGVFSACKVDADIAPINVGDLLTTSPTKGHAQKVLDPGKAVGAIVGKALGSLKKGKGKIPVMVMLQ